MKIQCKHTIIAIALISAVVRIFLLHPTFSDENFYFNAAKVFISGNLPYKDFFFAHPPLQLLLFGGVFEIFGTSFLFAKLVPLVFSTMSFVLVFFVGRSIFDEKSAFVAAISFLMFPAFLSFSLIGYGIFFAMALLLLSVLFYKKGRILLASAFFVAAFYARYFAAPFFLIFLILDKKKFKRFFIFSATLAILLFGIFYLVFGFDYINDTVLFHISSKVGNPDPLNSQYWEFNFPVVLLAAVAICYGFYKKEKLFVLLAALPLAVDVLLLFTLRIPFYHYFMLSLPFYAISIGKLFVQSNDKILRILIFGIIFFAVYNNITTIDYYLNPFHANNYFQISDFVAKNTNITDKIMGEPSIASYISFTSNISMPLQYTDSFVQHILYESPSDFVSVLQKEKPKFFIESHYQNSYYYFGIPEIREFVLSHYVGVLNVTGIPNYYVYQLKS